MEKLYKVSQASGATQVWWAEVNSNVITVHHGQLGGKIQTKDTVCKAMNVGRSNETTPEEQAFIEAEAMYQSQRDNKHYKDSEVEAESAASDCKIPRKLQNYKDHSSKMPYMRYVSRKKNGSRACVIEGTLYSKIGRAEDIKVEHLRKFVENLGVLANFDAEVYAEGLSLQRIRSAWLKPIKTDKELLALGKKIRKERTGVDEKFTSVEEVFEYLGYNPNEDAPKLKFYIFDVPVNGVNVAGRIGLMKELQESLMVADQEGSCYEFIWPVLLSKEDGYELHEAAVADGDEGVVYLDPEDEIVFGIRSYTCQKSKHRFDSEALVESVTEDKNGDGVLHVKACDKLDNVKFKLKMKVERRDGNRYERDYNTMLQLIGKWITFSYEELSDKGAPTKGVGEEVRECDFTGSPLN